MNMMRESLAQTRAALAGVAGMLGLAKRVWTGAKSATEGALCRSDLTRPFEVLDSTMVAGSPGRRVAGSPGRRVAGSPGRRVAGSPGRPSCVRVTAMRSAGARLRFLRPPASPPESSASAGRCSDTRRPASSSDSFDLSAARAAAGPRPAARNLRRGLFSALLGLPLLLGLAAPTAAQTHRNLDIQVADAYEGENIIVTLTLSSAPGSVSAAQRTFTVSTEVPTAGAVNTCIASHGCTAGSTPAAATDFTALASTNTVVFGANETVKTISIATATDNLSEGLEVVRINIDYNPGVSDLGIFTASTTQSTGSEFTGRNAFDLTPSVFPTTVLIESYGTISDGTRPAPEISIAPGTSPVTEGTDASFTVTATPAPRSQSVNLTVSQSGSFVASGDLGSSKTVTIGTSGEATYAVPTVDDSTIEANGSVTVTVNSGTGYTVASAPNNAATVTVEDDDDTTAPGVTSITRQSPTGQYTNADSLTWRVTFSEAVRNVDTTDFSLVIAHTSVAFPGATLAVSSVSTSVYDITASGSGLVSTNNSIQLVFESTHDIEDLSGNALPASPAPSGTNHNIFELDNTAPTVVSIERQSPTTAMTDADSLTWRVTFTDGSGGAILNVDATDFQVSGTTATITGVMEDTRGVFDVTASGGDLANLNATVTLSFANNHDIADDAGNALVNTTPTSGTNDNTFELQNVVIDPGAPQVVSIKRHAQEVRNLGTSLVWRVEFDKHLPNVYASDFTLTGTTAGLDVRHDLSNYDPKTYKTVVFVYAQGGDLETVSGTVTLNFAGNHNIRDFEGRALASTTPTSGTNQNSFTLDPTETLVYFTQADYYVDEGDEAVVTVKLSRLRDTATTISSISATPLTATGNQVDYHGQTFTVTIPAYRASGTVRIRTTDDTLTEDEERFRIDIHGFGLPAGVVVGNVPGGGSTDTQAYVHIRDDETATARANKEPGLVFDNAHLTWNEADGCGNTGPSYSVKLKNRPAGPVEVWIKDPDDDNSRGQNAFVANGRLYVANSPGQETRTVLRFTPGNWDQYQLVNVKVRCADHYTAQIPIKHRMYTNYTGDKGKLSHAYPGYVGVVDKGWTVHVNVRESDPPIVVKHLPAPGQPVDVKEGGHLDFEITLSQAAFEHDSTLTVYLSARGGKAAGVKRRDGDARSCGGPLDDCLIFTPSNRTQWVRLFAIDPGRDELKVEIPQLRWGNLEHVRDWEMRWPVEVIQAGQNSPRQDERAGFETAEAQAPSCVSDALLADARLAASETWRTSPGHVERWSRVLAAFGESNGYSPMTVAEAQAQADRGLKRWKPVAPALECLAAAPEEQPEQAEEEQAPAVTPELSLRAGSAVDEGGNATFTVTADPAPSADLTIAWTVAQSGEYLAAPGAGSRTVVLAAGATSVALSVDTVDDAADEADGSVSVTLGTGTGYTVATGKGSAAVAVRDNDEPVVSIAAGSGVTEGSPASFTVSASPVPAAPLDVTLTVGQSGDFAASGETGSRTVTVPVTGSVDVEVATVDDAADEPDGSIAATLGTGTGYTVAAAPDNAATVAVSDNDAAASGPTISIADASFKEDQGNGHFTVTLSEPAERTIIVRYATRDSTPVSARAGQDYFDLKRAWRLPVRIFPGKTTARIPVYIYNDSHDEDAETFEVVLFDADDGVSIADGVAVGTITNDDPMPAAWLARFGRTAAEQALDGIAGRIAAPRSAGVQGTIAGQTLNLDPGSGSGTGPGSQSGAANDNAAPGSLAGNDLLAQSEVARAFGAGHGGFGSGGPDGFGPLGFGQDRFGTNGAQSRSMTGREALLGSSFTATGEKDGTGGSLAFWGRAAQSSFDGREGTFSLDGEATAAMLGADYARGNWLVGMALMRSSGEGGYQDTDNGPQHCPDVGEGMDADAMAHLCGGAVREGDGKVEASLTAAVPYAAIQASERLKLWGALGYGTGEVTLKPEVGGSLSSDISWTMAAAGLRGDVIPPPAEGSGPALAVTSDALWARTSSEKTHELAASDSDVTRLRLGLEGSYRIATEGGGHLTPKLEAGMRHDGGDAETGFGVELGGGLAWVDPGLGLSLDVSGRTLIAHGNDDLKDRGFAASLAFDPDPASERGLSLALRQEMGGQARGGLDALFRADPLEDRTGSGETAARWTAEAAYGFPAFSGRFTGSPHVGLGLATAARDYSVGWRLTPAANANAPDISFGVRATRRESDTAMPEHTVGFEINARW